MLFSRTADYAIRAVLLLARQSGVEPLSTEDLAKGLGAPRNYLGKTLNTLVRHGILRSTRGPHGGFTLAVSPSGLSVADVVSLFTEQKLSADKCIMDNRPCNPDSPCAAHERWTDITERARAPLMRTTIAELCGFPNKLVADARVSGHTSAIVIKAGRNPIPQEPSHELFKIR